MDKLLSGRRILVVEDEMMVLMVTEDMLADLGCESVAVAATVEQALALIDAHGFDAAMLDVNLNGNKSYPVADLLVKRGVPATRSPLPTRRSFLCPATRWTSCSGKTRIS